MLKIHAIILALNEENFITAQLDTIYPFCDRISVITQYDRDWYGTAVNTDGTVDIILKYPDPGGKINLVVRRLPDEAAARNMEMLAFNRKSFKGIQTHGNPITAVEAFHNPPDYFWVIDADEIYDQTTIPSILSFLEKKNPRGMRVTGYNYVRTWNRRIPRTTIDFTHFGFVKPGVLFEQRRVVSWNEHRLARLFKMLRLPDWSAFFFGFINCPEQIGVFHHGCWLGDNARIRDKFQKSSHRESIGWEADSVDDIHSEYVPNSNLPINIQKAKWPDNFTEQNG
ncbi:hypothetical protein [Sediminibacterium ginsengisoli]|uniref:Glycosyl transferase family 2 n=1 Tax=Sediminibacterium ginsengisoli TaxID=413434 RepID=A0A1T4Q5K9_9BACT|nr:hypothetical protein [Sediminibacterium ginsengisoli]SJZ98827.1 hypothetical protein SAMN04488132_107149 [Sediminibacterium ginsengisoli]